MKKDITFTLPAEAVQGSTGALLLGDFNNWSAENAPRLEKQPDGSYKTTAQLEEGKTYQYRFLLDDGRWVNDYHAQEYVPVDGLYVDNCVITVPVSHPEQEKTSQQGEPANTKVVKASNTDKPTSVNKKVSKTKAPKKTTSKSGATKETNAKKTKPGTEKSTKKKRVRTKKQEDVNKEEK